MDDDDDCTIEFTESRDDEEEEDVQFMEIEEGSPLRKKTCRKFSLEDPSVLVPVMDIASDDSSAWRVSDVLSCAETMMSNCCNNSELVGKEKITKNILGAIKINLELRLPTMIWVVGANGTGKTTTVMNVLRRLRDEFHTFSGCYVSCSMLQSLTKKALVNRICEQLAVKPEDYDMRMCDQMQPAVIVLDEVDSVFTKKRSKALYPLLESMTVPGSTCIFVVISNARRIPLGLVEKKIISRLGFTKYFFEPYSMHEFVSILTYKLSGGASTATLPRIAEVIISRDILHHIAFKISPTTGDCRRLMFIATRLLKLAIQRLKTMDGDSRISESVVRVEDVDQHLREEYTSDSVVMMVSNFNLHLKIMMAAVHMRYKRFGSYSKDHDATCVPLQDAIACVEESLARFEISGWCRRDIMVEMHQLRSLGLISFHSRLKRNIPVDPECAWMVKSLVNTSQLLEAAFDCEPMTKLLEYCD